MTQVKKTIKELKAMTQEHEKYIDINTYSTDKSIYVNTPDITIYINVRYDKEVIITIYRNKNKERLTVEQYNNASRLIKNKLKLIPQI